MVRKANSLPRISLCSCSLPHRKKIIKFKDTQSTALMVLTIRAIAQENFASAHMHLSPQSTWPSQSANVDTSYLSHRFCGCPPEGRNYQTERPPLVELPRAILPPESNPIDVYMLWHVSTLCSYSPCVQLVVIFSSACSQVDGQRLSTTPRW